MIDIHFGAWNVMGLNARSRDCPSVKGAAVSRYCMEHSVSLLGMLETKVSLDH